MKKKVPSKIPKFRNDDEIAAFMEKYSAFDLVDAGLADIIPAPFFVRAQDEEKDLLERLTERIREGRIILWAGAGFSYYAGLPDGKELTEKIKQRLTDEELKYVSGLSSLPDVAEEFVQLRGSREELYQLIKNEIDKDYKDTHVHSWLTEIPQIRTIITTNYDKLFEIAYANELEVIAQSKMIPLSVNSNKVKLYKIHGDFSHPDNLIITKSDYTNFFRKGQFEPFWVQIQALVAGHPILFVGYSLEDPNIQMIFDYLIEYLGPYINQSFFVSPRLPIHKQRALSEKFISYIDMTGEELIEKLREKIHKYILEDAIDGKVDFRLASKIFSKKELEVTSQLNKEGKISQTRIGVVEGFQEKLDAKTSLVIEKAFFEKNRDFFDGERFGDLVIPAEKIKNFHSEINGINVPINEPRVTLKKLPLKSVPVTLLLKSSRLTIENVTALTFVSNSKVEFRFTSELIELGIVVDKTSKHNGQYNVKLNFTTHHPNTVIKGRNLFLFIHTWLSGDHLLVQNNIESILVEFPEEISIALSGYKDDFRIVSDIYDKLFTIQTHIQRTIKVPVELSKDDVLTIYVLNEMIVNKRMPISSFPINVTNKEKISEYLSGQTFQTKYTPADRKVSVNLFGEKIDLAVNSFEIKDAYIVNPEDVEKMIREGVNIKAIIDSKHKEAYLDF